MPGAQRAADRVQHAALHFVNDVLWKIFEFQSRGEIGQKIGKRFGHRVNLSQLKTGENARQLHEEFRIQTCRNGNRKMRGTATYLLCGAFKKG